MAEAGGSDIVLRLLTTIFLCVSYFHIFIMSGSPIRGTNNLSLGFLVEL